MSYLGSRAPSVRVTADDAAFWESVERRHLAFQCCSACNAFQHPPLPRCSHCGAGELELVECAGTGEIYTFTIVHHAADDALAAAVPYNISSISIDGCGDVRFVSNVLTRDAAELRIGRRVRLVWDELEEGGHLPRFELADEGATR